MITGGSSGIGAALARVLARRGWHCVLVARREERARAVAGEIGGEVELCDVGDRAAVERVAAAILKRHPRVSLLVNNAGIPGRRGFLDAEPERIEEVTRVNYLGGVWFTRALLPALEAAAPSHVVNVVSVAGAVAVGTSGLYTAAKHAQLAFSRSVAPELARRGVRTHAVLPGFVETEGFPQYAVHPRFLHPLVSRPEKVAKAIVRAVERNRLEVVVPRYYRVAIVAQALFPGLVARIGSSGRLRRPA